MAEYTKGDFYTAKNVTKGTSCTIRIPRTGMCKMSLIRWCVMAHGLGAATDKFKFTKILTKVGE